MFILFYSPLTHTVLSLSPAVCQMFILFYSPLTHIILSPSHVVCQVFSPFCRPLTTTVPSLSHVVCQVFSVFCSPLTNTVLPAGVRLVADVADAAVASSQVLTHAVLTDVRVQSALIDV